MTHPHAPIEQSYEQVHAQADVEPPGIALDFHVQDWRRFLELPVDHMLAVQPNTDR